MSGYVLKLKYEKVELNKSFDVSRKKIINYTIKDLNNAKYFLLLVQDMEDPKTSFDTKNELKDLNENEPKSKIKKAILATRVRKYIEREAKLF